MKPRLRSMGLFAAMAASLAFAMLDRKQESIGPTSKPAAREEHAINASREEHAINASREPRTAAPTTHTPVGAQDHAAAPGAVDLFAAKSWYIAPPPPPPPKPQAPPFPYTVTGSMSDGEDITLFLNQGERNFIVKKGDIVGGSYRLDDIADGRAEFTYLPLRQRQYLQIGKIN